MRRSANNDSPSANEIPVPAFARINFRRNGVFYIFGYRQTRYCPQKQKEPAIPAKAGISSPKAQTVAEGGTITRRFAAA
ncbi:MAG: hypothetical protein ACR2QC_12875 [Gammaproteobacteria bacterium]